MSPHRIYHCAQAFLQVPDCSTGSQLPFGTASAAFPISFNVRLPRPPNSSHDSPLCARFSSLYNFFLTLRPAVPVLS